MKLFAKIVYNGSLKTLNILEKSSILDAWLVPECGYNRALKTASKDRNYFNELYLFKF